RPTSKTYSSTSPATRYATRETGSSPFRPAAARLSARSHGALLQPDRPPDAHGDLWLPEPRRLRPRDARHRRSGEEPVQRAARADPEGDRDIPGDRALGGPGIDEATADR